METALDLYVYIILSGIVQIAAQVTACILLLFVLFRKGAPAYSHAVLSFTFFNAALLLWGCFGNLIWVFIARDRLYFAGDPLVECFPYFPFGTWAYDYVWAQQRGRLSEGVTLFEMRILWATISCFVWSLSWLTFRKMQPKLAA